MIRRPLLFLAGLFFLCGSSYGFPLLETEDFLLCLENYLRTDLISFNNVVDLDSGNAQDSSTYFGIDYSLAFELKFKNQGPRVYLKFERNGPYDYDAPLFIHHRLTVSGPSGIKAYRREELLPQAEEFWLDFPLAQSPLRFKAGLFAYEVGKGFAQGTGSFENYGLSIYYPGENFNWRLHYFRPDLVYKYRLGPKVRQEKQEGIAYEHNASNYFAFDTTFNSGGNKLQPFIGLLLDNTPSAKRANKFAAPVHREILGTLGLDYDINIKDFSFGFEVARNFGKAESESPDFKDVEHKGYLFYTNAAYNMGKFSPHCQFLYSSGNKVTPEMVDNGNDRFLSGKNMAFSTYSPLNTNLLDSLCPVPESLPLVFSGWGYGLSYGLGLNRPSTLADVCLLENLIMPSIGFDYQLTDKFSVTLDYWYIRANEKGIGEFEDVAGELSRDLGQEIDLSFSYDCNKHTNISLCTGYFFPGKYFKEKREDIEGSLFTPFVRGDGKADDAFQIELVTEFKF
jgi:hypothetical protein